MEQTIGTESLRYSLILSGALEYQKVFLRSSLHKAAIKEIFYHILWNLQHHSIIFEIDKAK